MKVLAEIGELRTRIKNYFAEMDRRIEEDYVRRYKSPEAVVAFKYHRRPNCPGPLEPISYPFMSPWGVGGESHITYTRCVECKGSDKDGPL